MRACAALLAAVLTPLPALAGPLSESCLVGDRPGASLLFPYFEVDLAAGDGATTLISINKIGEETPEPTQVHVVLWTDWGLPSISFDLTLETGTVKTFNLRSVLDGEIPPAGGLDTPACMLPLPPPPVDALELQARHTGREGPTSGLCWGSGRLGPEVATGYVTVDVVRDCRRNAVPGDDGYFDDGAGLATNDNVLFGELYLMDPGEDFAQGISAVPLVADADLFEPEDFPSHVPETFYDPWTSQTDSDDRTPLSSRHRARFLYGGDFDGTTDLLIWTAGFGAVAAAQTCGTTPFDDAFVLPVLAFDIRNESGEQLYQRSFYVPDAVTFRMPVGGDELPVDPGSFGTVEVDASLAGCLILLPCIGPMQSWVAPLIGARGRFSVGLEATRLNDPCR